MADKAAYLGSLTHTETRLPLPLHLLLSLKELQLFLLLECALPFTPCDAVKGRREIIHSHFSV